MKDLSDKDLDDFAELFSGLASVVERMRGAKKPASAPASGAGNDAAQRLGLTEERVLKLLSSPALKPLLDLMETDALDPD